ncbi:MAG: ADP-heptose--lipooligosaccharide heptosyltransferase II, partial [uncultured Phycisphaerae bacterium]
AAHPARPSAPPRADRQAERDRRRRPRAADPRAAQAAVAGGRVLVARDAGLRGHPRRPPDARRGDPVRPQGVRPGVAQAGRPAVANHVLPRAPRSAVRPGDRPSRFVPQRLADVPDGRPGPGRAGRRARDGRAVLHAPGQRRPAGAARGGTLPVRGRGARGRPRAGRVPVRRHAGRPRVRGRTDAAAVRPAVPGDELADQAVAGREVRGARRPAPPAVRLGGGRRRRAQRGGVGREGHWGGRELGGQDDAQPTRRPDRPGRIGGQQRQRPDAHRGRPRAAAGRPVRPDQPGPHRAVRANGERREARPAVQPVLQPAVLAPDVFAAVGGRSGDGGGGAGDASSGGIGPHGDSVGGAEPSAVDPIRKL